MVPLGVPAGLDRGEEVSHVLPVPLDCSAALFSEAVDGAWSVGGECLFDGHIVPVHQTSHVRIHVPRGEPGLLGEIHEVGFIDHVQGRHDHQASWFVNESVYLDLRLSSGRGLFVHCVCILGCWLTNRLNNTDPTAAITMPETSSGQPKDSSVLAGASPATVRTIA